MIKLILITIICCANVWTLFGQNQDSTLAVGYLDKFLEFEYDDSTAARVYSDSGIYFAKKSNNSFLLCKAHQYKGWYYQDRALFKKAQESFKLSLKVSQEANYAQGIADAYGNIGNAYLDEQDFHTSLKFQLLSLDKNLEILDEKPKGKDLENAKIGRTYALHNIGSIYGEIGMHEKALEYDFRSLQFELAEGSLKGISISYSSIARSYKFLEQTDSAVFYYKKAMALHENNEINYPFGYSGILFSYATLEGSNLSLSKRNSMFRKALEIKREVGDINGEMRMLISSVEIGTDTLDIDSLKSVLDLVKFYSLNAGFRGTETKYHFLRGVLNARTGNYSKAYTSMRKYIELKELSDIRKQNQDLIAGDIKHELISKQIKDSIKASEESRVKDAELLAEKAENRQHELEAEKQSVQKMYLFGGLGLALLFGLFIFNRFRVTRKQKSIIEKQKHKVDEAYDELEEKNQEILDSINYAKRIQSAILPPKKLVKEYLNNSFILYKPKDIVAGDFYWMEPTKDGVLFAAADCTGHGVPGAMVSVVCNNGLNRSVREHGLTEPGQILDKTREIVIAEFEKSEEEVKDGMDIALCSLQGRTLKYAGAHNPLWIIRKGATEVEEIKANKQPIGKYDAPQPYKAHDIELKKGDSFYIFSDGYADQFGGERGKKYKTANFKRLLLSIQNETIEQQRTLIDEAFEVWKGQIEQLDDVCVIGVRV